jgi:hypothetical protein
MRVRKEAFTDYFKVTAEHFLERTEENHEHSVTKAALHVLKEVRCSVIYYTTLHSHLENVLRHGDWIQTNESKTSTAAIDSST